MAAIGSVPLTLGSLYTWRATLTKDAAVWDLSAITVLFWWKRPDGTKFSQVASANSSGVCTYVDTGTQLNEIGDWTFSAFVTGFGYTVPVTFRVLASP